MAKRKQIDRNDPKNNKSLAVRLVMKEAPGATAQQVVADVKRQYGHKITPQFVYQLKSTARKRNRPANQKRTFSAGRASASPFSPEKSNGVSDLVQSIGHAKRLLTSAGSYQNAQTVLAAFKD